MPLFYIYHLIPAWLRTENIDLKTIGLFALVEMVRNLDTIGASCPISLEVCSADLWAAPTEAAALASADYPGIRHLAHRAVGASSICCVPALGSAALKVEKAIDGRDVDDLPTLVNAFQIEVSRVLDYGREHPNLFADEG